MPIVSPQAFFRFAAEHHALLVDLYQHRDGMTEARLLQLIRRHAGDSGPSASHVANRLQELGFIDAAPHATAQFEMTRPFAELMATLLREYRLTSVEVIRAYFTAMDHLTAEIGQAVAAGNGDALVRALKDAAEHVERMRHDSRRNREEVIATAMQVKSNRDRMSPRRRFEIINRLWTRYLVPLRDMVDTHKAMDASLDRAERVLAEAEDRFRIDGPVASAVSAARARVRRLRREVVLDFRESIREVAPLYEELRRENALARGASHALEKIMKQGLGALALPRRLGICNWQQQGLFSDAALEAYLIALHGYAPERPRAIAPGSGTAMSDHIPLDAFDAQVREALPIPDALAWLSRRWPDAPLKTVLRLYGRMHSGRYGPVSFGAEQNAYRGPGVRLQAHPMRLDYGPATETR